MSFFLHLFSHGNCSRKLKFLIRLFREIENGAYYTFSTTYIKHTTTSTIHTEHISIYGLCFSSTYWFIVRMTKHNIAFLIKLIFAHISGSFWLIIGSVYFSLIKKVYINKYMYNNILHLIKICDLIDFEFENVLSVLFY